MQTLTPGPGADATVPATPARLAAIAALVVALVGGFLGPSGRLSGLFGDGPVRVASGLVEVLGNEGWSAAPVGATLLSDTLFRVPSGLAVFEVANGVVDLAEGTQGTVGSVLDVRVGTVVVRAPGQGVTDGVIRVEGAGTWRYDAAGRVASYLGNTVLTDATGRQTLLRTLEQIQVSGAVVTDERRPYVYLRTDAFDRAWMARAMAVDDYIMSLRADLAMAWGDIPQPPQFYADFDGFEGQLVPLLGDVGFERDGDRVGPPADVLIAAVVTEALVVEASLPPEGAAEEVRAKRVAGATWGVVTQAREVDVDAVREATARALARRQQAEDDGTAFPPIQPEPVDGPGDGTDSPGDGGTTPPGPPTGPTPPSPPSEPPDEAEPGVVGGIVQDLGVDQVTEELGPIGEIIDGAVVTIDDLLDLLIGPDRDGLLGDVGDVLRNTTGLLAPESDGLLSDVGGVVRGTTGLVGGVLGPLNPR